MADDPINQQQFNKDVAAASSEDGFIKFEDADGNVVMPSPEEVWKMIDQMGSLTAEERATLKESLFNSQGNSAQEFMKRFAEPAAVVANTSWDYMIFLAMIVVLILIFALFGYKLYKSLMEKELKKQEKLKQKQSKKSKKSN